MPYDGSGNFVRSFPPGGWQGDATANIKIKSDRHDQHDNDLASGLSNALCKDGQSSPTADIPMNGKKIVNLGAPVNPNDAATKDYADTAKPSSTGLVISGADALGRLTFSSPTGANGLAWTGADLSWLAKLATAEIAGPPIVPATKNRLVLNDKADGTGTDVIECREDGSIKVGQLTVGGSTPTYTSSGLQYIQHQSDHVATYKKTGTYSFYWRKSSDGTEAGTGMVELMTLTDAGALSVPSHINAGGSLGAVGGAMVFGVAGSGRIMQFAPQWYWDWNAANGHLRYQTPAGMWIQLDGQLTIPANAYKPGGGSWLNGSDARIKDVQGDYADGLDKLLGLQPKTYQLKGNDQPPEGGMAPLALGRSYVGLIAQEAETVMPSLVEQRPGWIDGQEVADFRVLDTSELTFTLINAVKELSAKLDEANARIAALEAA